MDCERIQENVLAAVIEPHPPAVQAAIDAHLRGCAICSAFAARHARLDAALQAAIVIPTLSPRVRAAVRQRIRREEPSLWFDWLPDLVHFGSCGLVTVVSLVVLPFNPATVLAFAVGATLVSHAVLTAAHGSLEACADSND